MDVSSPVEVPLVFRIPKGGGSCYLSFLVLGT